VVSEVWFYDARAIQCPVCGGAPDLARIEDLTGWVCHRCGGTGDAVTYAVLEGMQTFRGAERLAAVRDGCRRVGLELPRTMGAALAWIASGFVVPAVAAAFSWRANECPCCESAAVAFDDQILWLCGECRASGSVITYAALLSLAAGHREGLAAGVAASRAAGARARASDSIIPVPA